MRNIAIAAGGDSSEYKISINSARAVSEALQGIYNCYIIVIRGKNWYWEDANGMAIPLNKNDFSLNLHDSKLSFDAVFVAIHGTPGENGLLQGYLDMLDIPYTSCDAFCSALTFNKNACKVFLKDYGIPMAPSLILNVNDKADLKKIQSSIGFPCFVKPNASGSSFGVSLVKSEPELEQALSKAFKEDKEVLVETYLKGVEVGCGILKTLKKEYILPVTEIVSKNAFFDYEAKYTPGAAEEITPARLTDDIYKKVQELSSVIYDNLGCKGVVRVDFIIVNDKPVFLEINSVPGMTAESIIPKQLSAFGITQSEFYSAIIEDLF